MTDRALQPGVTVPFDAAGDSPHHRADTDVLDAGIDAVLTEPAIARPSGPDVSDYNPNVNWASVRAAGHDFAIAKATEGLTWKSTTFPGRWPAMRKAGLIRGAYHFARPQPGRSGADEARAFLRYVDAAGGFKPGDLRPVLDLETSSGISAARTLRFAYEFAIAVKEHVGMLPIIYTGAFWRDQMGNPPNGLGCHLWLAAFVKDPAPYVPRAWSAKGWSMWQYTSNGSCPGIPGRCDLNVVRDKDTLAQLRLKASSDIAAGTEEVEA